MDDRASAPAARMLGRSRGYSGANVPQRLQRWHAPRANRWEWLCVDAGALDIELLDGHDEKEEQLVYPDIAGRLGDAGAAMTREAIVYPAIAIPR